MAATYSNIKEWLSRAQPEDTHMIVVYDSWDHEDYPIYVRKGANINEIIASHDDKNMERVMEVYNLKMDIETQMKEYRAWHL